MPTLLQLQKRRADAQKALSAATTEKARAKATEEFEASVLALAAFNAKLAAKSVKKVTKEERYEESDEDEDEDEEASDDEPKKPAQGDDDDSDDDSDDDDSDDEEDEDEDESEDEDEDEDEEDEDEDEDERAAASFAVASAKKLLAAAERGKNKRAIRTAREHLKAVQAAASPKALERRSSLKALVQRVTGKKNMRSAAGALEALAASAKSAERVAADVARLKASSRRERVDAMIATARREGRVAKTQVKSLRERGMADPKWLKGFLAASPPHVRTLGEGAREGSAPDGQPERDGSQARAEHLDKQNLTKEQRTLITTLARDTGKSFDEFLAEMNTQIDSRAQRTNGVA